MTTDDRTTARLDVSVGVLLAELNRDHTEHDDVAYREAAFLVSHPDVRVSTAADYPGWVPARMDPADYARSVRDGFVDPVVWDDDAPSVGCAPSFVQRASVDVPVIGDAL